MIDIKIEKSDLERAFGNLNSNIQETAPLMRRIAGALKIQTDMNLRQGLSAEGEPFTDLAEITKEKRAKKRKWPGRVLQVDLLLTRSITKDYGDTYSQIGSNLPYARRHQLGDIKGDEVTKGGMLPARPYMPIKADGELQEGVEGRLLQLTLDHLKKGCLIFQLS